MCIDSVGKRIYIKRLSMQLYVFVAYECFLEYERYFYLFFTNNGELSMY